MEPTIGFEGAVYFGNNSTYAESTVWTEVQPVEDIQPNEVEAADIETTHLKSEENYADFRGGKATPGEVTVTAQYSAELHETIAGLFRVKKGWRVLFADNGATHEGGIGLTGHVKKIGNPFEAEGKVMIQFVIKVSGKPVVIPATAA